VIGELTAAAASLSIGLKFVASRSPAEIDPAFSAVSQATFSAVSQAHAQALYVIEDPLFDTPRPAFLKLAFRTSFRLRTGLGTGPTKGG
jgi:hypothetical protein